MPGNVNNCEECGEKEFTLKDGFYYCNECGTQSQHVRLVEVDEHMGEDEMQILFSTIKVKSQETVVHELTTWECFNYLLRGLVEELLGFGAKEELKQIVLQLWTTYLRKIEVAFFSKKEAHLPRLGPKYSQRDAKILYNHAKMKRIRVRKLTGDRKESLLTQKRRHTKAEYARSLSLSGQSQSTSAPSTSQNSSSTASNRPIRLNFSRKARKYYKRFMPANHLKRHEFDGTGELECHTLHSNKFKGPAVRSEVLSRKTIYALLYLGLNLIEDDIQLCDLLRFMREGHISTSNISHFFPDNIANDCMNIIRLQHNFGWTFFRSKAIRKEAVDLSHFINVQNLKLPNLVKIATRFVNDLSLPPEIAIYIERLYNLHPSNMKHRPGNILTPCYEGRAMAYVIFTLKLLFVLDGKTERIISNSARTINTKLTELGHKDKLLFVWEDWVKFIEMRRVILTQCHYPTSAHLDENVNMDQYVDHLKTAYETSYDDVINSKKPLLINMEKIFDDLHAQLSKKKLKQKIVSLKCPPSFTPFHTYLQYILNDSALSNELFIPEFVRNNPAALDINPYVNAKELKKIFADNEIQLKVKKLTCRTDRNVIGVFKSYSFYEKLRQFAAVRVRSVEHDIDEDVWIEQVKSAPKLPDIFAINNKFKRPAKPKNPSKLKKIETVPSDNVSTYSFDIFSEQNMEPLSEDIGDKPRNFETDSILTDITDDDDEEDQQRTFKQTVRLKTSNFDCWNFFGINQYFSVFDVEKIEKQPPLIFQWLLKTCAEMVEVEVIDLYQELLAIENQFIYSLESMDDFNNLLSYKLRNNDKDIHQAVNFYKNLW